MITRIVNIVLATLSVIVIVTITSLTPETSGIGTHMQIIPVPCIFKTLFGVQCPSCGLTTSLAYLMDGNFAASFHSHPLGIAVFVSLLTIIIVSAIGLVKNWAWWQCVERRWFQWVVICGMGVYLVVWIIRLSF